MYKIMMDIGQVMLDMICGVTDVFRLVGHIIAVCWVQDNEACAQILSVGFSGVIDVWY